MAETAQIAPDIRILCAKDATAFQELRLFALRECPTAFASSYEDECDLPLQRVGERLAPGPDRAVLGAFRDGKLVGTVGIQRDPVRKRAHRASIWGVYVATALRKKGIGRQLLKAALDYATTMPGVRQVSLGANTTNPASIALYKALGFEPYGVETGFLLVDGVLHDEVLMSRAVPTE